MSVTPLLMPKQEIRALQMLRFVAAAMVVVGHVMDILRRGHIAGHRPFPDPTGIPWHAGVDIFFIISGFVMYFLMADEFARGGGVARTFLARRIIRIAPLYWIFTAIAIVVMLLIPGEVNNNVVAPLHVLLSTVFVPWPAPSGALIPPLSVGWTLNFEFLFYCLFTVALLFKRAVGLAIVVLIFGLLILNHEMRWSTFPPIASWGQPIILEFLYGIGLASLFLKGLRLPVALRLALFLGGFGCLILANLSGFDTFQDRWWAWGMPSAMIVAGTVLGEDFPDRKWVRVLVLGGGASYALYLSHLFSLRGLGLVWERTAFSNSIAFGVCALFVSIGVSVIIHLWIERPLLTATRHLFARPHASRPATQARMGSTQ